MDEAREESFAKFILTYKALIRERDRLQGQHAPRLHAYLQAERAFLAAAEEFGATLDDQ